MGAKGPRKKRRRIRSPHPGVVVLQRKLESGGVSWRARYKDPDTGRERWVTLDKVVLPTAEARRDWAIRRSRSLAKRRMEIACGAPRRSTVTIEDAIASFVASCEGHLRPATVTTYKAGISKFQAWTDRAGLELVADITQGHLSAFRDTLKDERLRVPREGGMRGQRRATRERRSPASVNSDLATVSAMLNHWRRRQWIHFGRDDIADVLKRLRVPKPRTDFMSTAECSELLDAAMRHDAARFLETRAEHAGRSAPGCTSRYDELAPFVAVMLLTGMRLSEALALKWSDVELGATDERDDLAGAIHLRAEAVKTGRARDVWLDVAPTLRRVLAAMKLRASGGIYVFGGASPPSRSKVDGARKRLVATFGAPRFSWQRLRRTTGTFLTNAPGIYGAASIYRSAVQLGHSVKIAERYYLGVLRGIPRSAHTLEEAMGIEDRMQQLLLSIATRRALRAAR